MKFLRSDLPERAPFSISELPHRAKLDQNEAAIDLPSELKADLARAMAAESWNRYPQPKRYVTAKAAFAQAVGIPPERLALTFGGDQTILAAFFLAGGADRRALFFEPTYPMLSHYARVTGTPCERVVLGPEMLLTRAHLLGDFALRCFVSPNNPTGGRVDDALVQAALDHEGLVFVDEAYADFAGESVLAGGAQVAADNLLVGRSLSKALLAGLRLGYAIGAPEVIALVEQIFFAPYHLSSAQLVIAERFADIKPHVERAVAQVRAERTRLVAALATLVPRVHPSVANFVLFDVPSPARVAGALAQRGIRIRDVSRLPGLSHHLRVTIGTRSENDAFLAELADVLRSG
jgi:histidinol-phosphate aminotransferase